MSRKDKSDQSDSKAPKITTLVGVVFVIIFLLAGYAMGGIVPAAMTIVVLFFIIQSLKKQFAKVEIEEDDEESSEGGEKSSQHLSKSEKTISIGGKGVTRVNGESFDNFLLRRFGLTKTKPVEGADSIEEYKLPEEDQLYNPEEYESANTDLSQADPNVVTINGEKYKFHHKTNPFEV